MCGHPLTRSYTTHLQRFLDRTQVNRAGRGYFLSWFLPSNNSHDSMLPIPAPIPNLRTCSPPRLVAVYSPLTSRSHVSSLSHTLELNPCAPFESHFWLDHNVQPYLPTFPACLYLCDCQLGEVL